MRTSGLNWAVVLSNEDPTRSCNAIAEFVATEFRSGLADFQQGIEGTQSNEFMRSHYRELLRKIFGDRGNMASGVCWTVSAEPGKPLWKAMARLLGVKDQGSLFIMLLESRLNAQYAFPILALPRHLRQLIAYGQEHPTRDFCKLLYQNRQNSTTDIFLDPMEYFLFSFVHFAVSPWRQGDRDRSYVNDMRARSKRELVANLAGTTIESRGSALDAMTIPQLCKNSIYIELLLQYLQFLWPRNGLYSGRDAAGGVSLLRRVERYRIVLTSLVIEFWLEQNEMLKLAQRDRQTYQHISGRSGAIMVYSPSRHRQHQVYEDPTRCQIEAILTFMTYILADPKLQRSMLNAREGHSLDDGGSWRGRGASSQSPFDPLPSVLQDVQLPLYEFFAGAFAKMRIATSSGLADHQHLFGSVCDVWYSCVLQPWNASRRLTSKASLGQSTESTSQRRRGAMFDNIQSALRRGSNVATGDFGPEWESYVALNYIFYAPLLLKFVRRAAVEFIFDAVDTAHFDMLWEVLRFFMPDHSRPGPLWNTIRRASRVLHPLLREVRDVEDERSSFLNPNLRDAIQQQCRIVFQYGIAQDTLAGEYETPEEIASASHEQLWDAWLRECTWPSRMVDARGSSRAPSPRTLRGQMLVLCKKLLASEATICKVAVPGRRMGDQSATLFFAKAAARVIEMGTGQSGDNVRKQQFEHTLCRIGEMFNLKTEIAQAKVEAKKRGPSAMTGSTSSHTRAISRTKRVGYDRVLPAFLTPKSRADVFKGVSRVRRRQLRFVGDDMMRPITRWECPWCPCIVRSLVRLSLMANAALDRMYMPTSSGISSEYDSTRRLRQVVRSVESLPANMSASERDRQLSVMLRAAMTRGEASVVRYLEAEGAKLQHTHSDFTKDRRFRVNLRFLADVRNWFRAAFVWILLWCLSWLLV